MAVHKCEFLISLNHYKRGHGCPQCGRTVSALTNISNRALEFHTKYTSRFPTSILVFDNFIYTRNNHKSVVTCKEHGEFTMSPNSLLSGHGCPACAAFKTRYGRAWNDFITPCMVYILYFEEHLVYKIGVTTKSIKERYRKENINYTIVFEKWYTSCAIAYRIENYLLHRSFYQYRTDSCALSLGGNSELRTQIPDVTKQIEEAEVFVQTEINNLG